MDKYFSKYKIKIAAIVLLLGCILAVAIYTANTFAETTKIDVVKSIMLNERETESPVRYLGLADEIIAGKGKYSLNDDLFEYVFDPDGYIISVSRTTDKTSDPYNSISENHEDLENRALNLHLRNLEKWLRGSYFITNHTNRMGDTTIEIREIQNGNPTGRMTYVNFSKGGALISLVSTNKPVSEAELVQKENISKEAAAEIAFSDISKQYGDVLGDKDFSTAQWIAVKEAFDQRLVWTITFTTLTRSDFKTPDKSWGAIFRVDVLTGDILERAYQE
jgi:hypothetical protein